MWVRLPLRVKNYIHIVSLTRQSYNIILKHNCYLVIKMNLQLFCGILKSQTAIEPETPYLKWKQSERPFEGTAQSYHEYFPWNVSLSLYFASKWIFRSIRTNLIKNKKYLFWFYFVKEHWGCCNRNGCEFDFNSGPYKARRRVPTTKSCIHVLFRVWFLKVICYKTSRQKLRISTKIHKLASKLY